MKYTNKCPKCSFTGMVRIPGRNEPYGYGRNIRVGITPLSAVLVTKYVCCNCGYIEDWVDFPQDIEKIKNYYQNNNS